GASSRRMPTLTARQATVLAVGPFEKAVTTSIVRPRRAAAQASAPSCSLTTYPATLVPGSGAFFCGWHRDGRYDIASARLRDSKAVTWKVLCPSAVVQVRCHAPTNAMLRKSA